MSDSDPERRATPGRARASLEPDQDATVEPDQDARSTPFSPGWWNTSHPTFAAIAGFFAGMLYVALVPGGIAAVLRYALDDQSTKTAFFPVVVGLTVLPAALLIPRKTRRFGAFVLLGIAVTVAVVVGVTSLVLYLLVQTGN